MGNKSSKKGTSTKDQASASLDCAETVHMEHAEIRNLLESTAGTASQESEEVGGKAGSVVNCMKNGSIVTISLVPHQHTLFCERKQRVCTAIGKVQELEVLQVHGLNLPLVDCVWVRTAPNAGPSSTFSPIVGTENKETYTLQVEDVDCYISVRHVWLLQARPNSPATPATGNVRVVQAKNALGPVAAGPARLLNMKIVSSDVFLHPPLAPTKENDEESDGGDEVPLYTGDCVIAQAHYLGGQQGCSEYWWVRTRVDGKRETMQDPRPAPLGSVSAAQLQNPASAEGQEDDPRVYWLLPCDEGCTLKVKCRPIRIDGYKGEIFTSKACSRINKCKR